jgi:peptidylprolyl isomerase
MQVVMHGDDFSLAACHHFLSGGTMIKATRNDTVKVHYIGRLKDGTIFDQTPEDRPLHFILGKEEVIEGFDNAVDGMYQGESKTVTIPFAQAYGPRKTELIEEIDRTLLPKDIELVAGGQLEVTQDDGSVFHVMVRELSDQSVTLDANHPLAGQDLTFDITLQHVSKRPEG